MGFTSSIHIGASGVMAQQERMSVISDNIANLNTVGFKSSNMLFNNLISKQLTGADAGNQVGQGVGVSSILPNMSPGALESTNTPTDIAVGGKGFFLIAPESWRVDLCPGVREQADHLQVHGERGVHPGAHGAAERRAAVLVGGVGVGSPGEGATDRLDVAHCAGERQGIGPGGRRHQERHGKKKDGDGRERPTSLTSHPCGPPFYPALQMAFSPL